MKFKLSISVTLAYSSEKKQYSNSYRRYRAKESSCQRTVGVSDIAKHAGVSIGTVSNYLNYPERVSETLKAKIGAAIQELGYVPRRAAPSPAQTTTGTPIIGYVMTDIEHSLFSFIFEGAQEVCEENGMQIIGLNASSDLERQHELIRTLIGMKVAGILLSTVQDSAGNDLLQP